VCDRTQIHIENLELLSLTTFLYANPRKHPLVSQQSDSTRQDLNNLISYHPILDRHHDISKAIIQHSARRSPQALVVENSFSGTASFYLNLDRCSGLNSLMHISRDIPTLFQPMMSPDRPVWVHIPFFSHRSRIQVMILQFTLFSGTSWFRISCGRDNDLNGLLIFSRWWFFDVHFTGSYKIWLTSEGDK